MSSCRPRWPSLQGPLCGGGSLAPLRGRSPLYRLAECCTHQDTARLLGQAVAPAAVHDDPVGRIVARLSATGTMQVCTACAVRADRIFGFDKRSVHCDTPSIMVYGDSLPPEEAEDAAGPLRITYGESQDKRPDLKPCGFATLCVARAVPLGGQPEAGNASDQTGQHTLLSDIAPCLATPGGAPGAYSAVAEAALVTEATLAALGDTLCLPRLPATDTECGRLIAEAVAHTTWEAVGVLAHTQPTTHRPATSEKAYEGEVPRSGTAYRAVVIYASAQDTRRQQRLVRAIQASYDPITTLVQRAARQEYGCRADADAAAAKLRAVSAPDPRVEVTVEERPLYGRGRPRAHTPRPVKALRYRLPATITPQTERIVRLEAAAGCFVVRTHVPTAGDLAQSARGLLSVYKDHHGTEQPDGFLKESGDGPEAVAAEPARLEA